MVSSFLFIFAGMEKIYNYYQDIVTAYTRRADNLKKKIHLLGSIRLLSVSGCINQPASFSFPMKVTVRLTDWKSE